MQTWKGTRNPIYVNTVTMDGIRAWAFAPLHTYHFAAAPVHWALPKLMGKRKFLVFFGCPFFEDASGIFCMWDCEPVSVRKSNLAKLRADCPCF